MKAFKRIFAAATLLVTTGLASEVNAQVPLEAVSYTHLTLPTKA